MQSGDLVNVVHLWTGRMMHFYPRHLTGRQGKSIMFKRSHFEIEWTIKGSSEKKVKKLVPTPKEPHPSPSVWKVKNGGKEEGEALFTLGLKWVRSSPLHEKRAFFPRTCMYRTRVRSRQGIINGKGHKKKDHSVCILVLYLQEQYPVCRAYSAVEIA